MCRIVITGEIYEWDWNTGRLSINTENNPPLDDALNEIVKKRVRIIIEVLE